MDTLRVLWAMICYLVVALVGFSVMGPWGLVVAPLLVTAAAAIKISNDRANVERLRVAMVNDRAKADETAARAREAQRRMEEAIAHRDEVDRQLREEGWVIPTREDFSSN